MLPTQPTGHSTAGHSLADQWLTKEQVLSLLYISGRTLQRWRSRKILSYSRIGNKIYYRRSDIEAMLESRRVGG